MLEIQKDYNDEYIVYEFIGSLNVRDLEKVETMLREDISKTYAFIFSFRYLNYIDTDAVELLQKVYLLGVNNACEMTISGLNAQVAMVLEIFQTDKIYTIKKSLQEAKDMYEGGYDETLYYS